MRTRHRVHKSEAAAAAPSNQATHRLTEIDVSEVSIVDRGANQRTYLVVKEADKKAKPEGGASEQKTEKAGEAPAAPASQTSGGSTPTTPSMNITAEAKAQMLATLKSAQERIGVITKTVNGATVSEGATLPQELVDEMTKLSQLFQPAEPDKADAEKAGRKISSARMQQLQSMRATLDALIEETSAAQTSDATTEEQAEPSEAEKSADKPKPSQELAEVSGAVAKLATTVAKMVEVFEGQNQRIDALAKSAGESRQPDLDAGQQPREPKKVVWDMDMASPLKTVQ